MKHNQVKQPQYGMVLALERKLSNMLDIEQVTYKIMIATTWEKMVE